MRLTPVVLVADVACAVLVFFGPDWLKPWLGVAPALAILLALIPVVRTATKAANNA